MANSLRDHVIRLLTWQDAHVSFETAVEDLAPDLRGTAPAHLPYSPWQLIEHMRLAQTDILDFCRNSAYEEARWPDDYWPSSSVPGSDEEWYGSISSFLDDREELTRMAANPKLDLLARIPHGTGQTYLRELLLTADHTAYHVGELVVVRRLLGAWLRD